MVYSHSKQFMQVSDFYKQTRYTVCSYVSALWITGLMVKEYATDTPEERTTVELHVNCCDYRVSTSWRPWHQKQGGNGFLWMYNDVLINVIIYLRNLKSLEVYCQWLLLYMKISYNANVSWNHTWYSVQLKALLCHKYYTTMSELEADRFAGF